MQRGITTLLLLITALGSPAALAARLSPCQGQFEAVRGPGYGFAITEGERLLGPALASDLAVTTRALFDLWGTLLAAAPPFTVDVQLALLDDAEAFAARKAALAPELPDVTGFYSGSSNTAVVLLQPDNPAESRRRALHEISHLLTVTQAGPAPYWLAEGLAEFHEMLRVEGSRVEVLPNDRHLQRLARTDLPALAEVLAAPPQNWQQRDSQAYYSVAWSLVYFLMSSPEGRGALGFTLQQASTHSCGPYRARDFLDYAWPGGMVALEQSWGAWLDQGKPAAIALQLRRWD